MHPPEEKLYKIGVNADCPVHQVTVGGQCFPRTSEHVTGYGVETRRTPHEGAVVLMQPGQLDLIKSEVKHKVIRSTSGKKARSRVWDTRARRYRALPADVPVAKYLYVRDLSPEDNPHGKGPAHVTLADEAKAEAPSVEPIGDLPVEVRLPAKKVSKKDKLF